ncbi:FliG C-terminal domain-containing protein [Salinispira pacifica]
MDLNKRRIGAYRKFAGPGRDTSPGNPPEEEQEEHSTAPRRAKSEPRGDGTGAKRAPTGGKASRSRQGADRRSPPDDTVKSGDEAGSRGKGGAGRSGSVRSRSDGPGQNSTIPPDAFVRMTQEGASSKGRRRVAELLMLLGKEEAAGVLKHLDPGMIETITSEIASMGAVGKTEAERVLADFGISVRRGEGAKAGGVDTAREMLTAAFGAESAEELLARVVPEAAPKPLEFLNDLEPQQIQILIRNESIPVKSIVLAHLSPPIAAQVIATMSADARRDVVKRVAHLGRVDREVLARIEETFREKVRASGRVVSSEVDGKGVLAQILRHLGTQQGEQLLAELEREAPDLSADIRDRLFTIDTLLLIDDGDLQKVLQGIPDEEIALILKGKTEEIRGKVLRNASERRRSFVMEEYQRLGAMPRREVDKATREFISTLKQLESEGRIVVRRPDERYV